jgi:hypothetical protein
VFVLVSPCLVGNGGSLVPMPVPVGVPHHRCPLRGGAIGGGGGHLIISLDVAIESIWLELSDGRPILYAV